MVAQGTTLAGRYRLDTRIGAGGMGEVWRGEDVVLARTVAVKVLLPGRMQDPGFVARFQGEARAMATINHSGVVDVYDYGVSGDTVYLVMKFVDGEPLDRLLARLGRIPPQAAMELIAQAASALQAVHDQGIVHRDVKPGNLLVQRDGTLVLTDFGIARSDIASRLTDAGMVLGTAAYCAPEQAEGAPVTPAVDIYALGVVAYECLVGQRPFDGDSAVTIALKHIREAPPPLPQDIPPAVRQLVEIALSKDPARRYPSARAMSEAAKAIVSGQTPAVPDLATGATMAPPPEAYQQQSQAYQQQGQPYQQGQGYQQQGQPYQQGQGYQQQGQPYQQTGQPFAQQTGQHDADPYKTGARLAHEDTAVAERRGSRRAAKAPRRTGLIAGIAAAVVLGAGATAVALTGIPTLGTPEPTFSYDNQANARGQRETKPPQPKESTAEPEPDPEPTTQEPKQPERRPDLRPTRDEEPEPTKTPTTSPSTSPSPSKSPSPTPSNRVLVPAVVGKLFTDGQSMVEGAELVPVLDDRTTTTDGLRCGRIKQTVPGVGKPVAKGSSVTLVVIDSVCPGDGSPTPTPSATPTTTATPKP
ncbi:serine/threonine-protein kinase [Nonomuraea candida]|uniref:serine/threonine-protein kinase n=1 Tax=Nonomuraea candida TaxID=359159 RepID=UPI0005BAC9E2|nr:serine/threonine-protein kinase [Nonomuraea candida]